MDYNNGSRLIKPQWDLVHNPELTTGLLDDEADGAMKVGIDKLLDILQKIRCAYASNRRKVHISTTFDNEIFSSFEMANKKFEIMQLKFVTPADKPDFELSSVFPIPQNGLFNGPVLVYNFNGVKIRIREKDKTLFEEFMNKSDFENEYKLLSYYIKNNQQS